MGDVPAKPAWELSKRGFIALRCWLVAGRQISIHRLQPRGSGKPPEYQSFPSLRTL